MIAAPDLSRPEFEPEPRRFRRVLGHFCTGVTVVTTADDDGPAGFACQSFSAVSLEPPLVLFCPSRTSATWPRIERSGHFCANVLTEDQRDLARTFAVSGAAGTDKFAGVRWSPSPSGAPILDGVLTWVAGAGRGRGTPAWCGAGSSNWAKPGPPRRCCSTAAAMPPPTSSPGTARPRLSTPCSPGPATLTGCSRLDVNAWALVRHTGYRLGPTV